MQTGNPKSLPWGRSLLVVLLCATSANTLAEQLTQLVGTAKSSRLAQASVNKTTRGKQLADREASVDILSMTKHPPTYPSGEEGANVSGTVVLQVLVGADGSIKQVKMESSTVPRVLEVSASAAARTWRYNTKIQGGKSLDAWVRLVVDFKRD